MDLANIFDNLSILKENILLKRIAVVVVYIILAKAADLFIDRVLRRLTRLTKVTFDDQLIGFLHAPICWTIFWLGIWHALILPPALPSPWVTVLPSIAKTAILIAWLFSVLKFLGTMADRSFDKLLARGTIGKDLFFLLKNVARVIVVATGLLWLLSIWQVDLTPLFASAGIAGIAVALAAKDTLANFFGGISIFADKTFKVGDYIILDNAERGEVVEIGIRSTRIKTRDDVLITIPNSILANSKIINESAPIPRFRIRVPVSVAYGSDMQKVEKTLLNVADANPAVVSEPSSRVRLRTFGESSIDFELLCWVNDPSLKGLEIHNLLKAIYNDFAEQEISIPFPQRDVHIKEKPTMTVGQD